MIVGVPILCRAQSDISNDLFLDQIVRHLLSRAERGFARALEQLSRLRRRWQRRNRWVIASTHGFFQSMNQRSIVTALGRDQRTQAGRDRESNPALANLIFQVSALLRMSRQLIQQTHEFLVRERRALLQVSRSRKRRAARLPRGQNR